MKINKKIIIFTYDYPVGNSENTFLNFELSNLTKNFKKIEIIPHKYFKQNFKKPRKKNINYNLELSKKFNLMNLIINFFVYTLLSSIFYNEVKKIIFKKKFFMKMKFLSVELTKSEIAYKWIKQKKLHLIKNVVFYSFWSNFLLLTFERIKKDNLDLITISRTLGSDLNGFFKNDNYVPFIKKKFYSLSKVFVLANFQKKKLISKNLIKEKKIVICPIGVFKQNKNQNHIKKTKILFLSCNNFIKIKNTLLIISFLKKFSKKINKKVVYFIIGKGEEKEKIISSLNNCKNLFEFKLINSVKSLIDFIKKKRIDFFLNFSSKEGMSFSIMEAMSCGVPVISSNIDANINLVKKNSGYFINLENFDKSSNLTIKKIMNDIQSLKNYKRKVKNSKSFIDKNLINYNCYQKFKKEIKSL